mgnify:CR=1 FL=1
MTAPRPKRFLYCNLEGLVLLEYATRADAEKARSNLGNQERTLILETLDEEQERKLTHYERLEELSQEVARAKIVLNEVFNFPLHKQFEEGAGGLRKRYEMAGNAWKRIAAADAALGRKP